MTMNSVVAAIATVLLTGFPSSAQSTADLLQKGIYAQVADPASGNKS